MPAASASAAASAAHSSAMLRASTRDAQAQFSLTLMLCLGELAELHSTCRAWHQWLERPSLLPASASAGCFESARRLRCLSASDAVALAAAESPLARTHLLELLLNRDSADVRRSPVALLGALPRFSRLASLDLTLDTRDLATYPAQVAACFDALAPTLRVLRLELDTATLDEADEEAAEEGDDSSAAQQQAPSAAKLNDWPASKIFDAALQMVTSRLMRLEKFELDGFLGQKVECDFACLQKLPLLASFGFPIQGDRCSALQAQQLGACKTLTAIDCGEWSAARPPTPGNSDSDSDDDDDDERTARNVAAEAVAASTPLLLTQLVDALSDASRPAPFRDLELQQTEVGARVWAQLLRLPTLTKITPQCFLYDITPQHWMQLGTFTGLRTLRVKPYNSGSLKDTLPGLLQCRQLSDLRIECVQLSAADLESVCTGVNQLDRLILRQVRLPASLAALALAPRLRELHCWLCTIGRIQSADPPAVAVLAALPAVARLDTLVVTFRDAVDPQQRASLLARCPRLGSGGIGFVAHQSSRHSWAHQQVEMEEAHQEFIDGLREEIAKTDSPEDEESRL